MRDFNHTVNILVQAFFKGTLEHRDCTACAVGNIIRGNGYTLKKDRESSYTFWLRHIEGVFRRNYGQYDYEEAMSQIDSTGYTPFELHQIETAFEKSYYYDSQDHEQERFNGLMAVVDVLASIHGIDLSIREEAKLLFVKPSVCPS